MIWVLCILGVVWVVAVSFRSTHGNYKCICSSFTPNRHDADCAVCRGYCP